MHPQVVAAVLHRGDQVLLCHRSPTRRWYPDVWDLPGGHVEPHERPRDALRRELIEEVGVDIGTPSDEPVLQLEMASGLHLAVWHVTNWHGVVENCDLNEHDHIGWFTENNVKGLDLAHSAYFSLLQGFLTTDPPRLKT